MTDVAWRADLERVLSWTQADERTLDRIGARFGEDQRALLRAVIETRGDMRALAERLGPIAAAKLRARVRIPQRVREPVEAAWRAVEAPLKAVGQPPLSASPDEIATYFIERYGARLDAITGEVTKAAAAARSLAGALRTVAGAKDLLEAVTSLEAAIGELRAAATTCAHPEDDRTGWTSHAETLAREGIDAAEAVRTLRSKADELATRFDALARSLTVWADAPPATRAAQAEAMATRVRAAADLAAGMHQELLGAIVR